MSFFSDGDLKRLDFIKFRVWQGHEYQNGIISDEAFLLERLLGFMKRYFELEQRLFQTKDDLIFARSKLMEIITHEEKKKK